MQLEVPGRLTHGRTPAESTAQPQNYLAAKTKGVH
jgi:hypothetical protein